MGIIAAHKTGVDLWKCVDKRQQRNKLFIINSLYGRYKPLYMGFGS